MNATTTLRQFAAIVDSVIFGTGETPAAARLNAIRSAGFSSLEAWDFEAAERGLTDFDIFEMSPAVAAEVEAHGFDGAHDSYDAENGVIVQLFSGGRRVV